MSDSTSFPALPGCSTDTYEAEENVTVPSCDETTSSLKIWKEAVRKYAAEIVRIIEPQFMQSYLYQEAVFEDFLLEEMCNPSVTRWTRANFFIRELGKIEDKSRFLYGVVSLIYHHEHVFQHLFKKMMSSNITIKMNMIRATVNRWKAVWKKNKCLLLSTVEPDVIYQDLCDGKVFPRDILKYLGENAATRIEKVNYILKNIDFIDDIVKFICLVDSLKEPFPALYKKIYTQMMME